MGTNTLMDGIFRLHIDKMCYFSDESNSIEAWPNKIKWQFIDHNTAFEESKEKDIKLGPIELVKWSD